MDATLQQTIDLLKQLQQNQMTQDELAKATFAQPSTATTGLQLYNLEPAAKQIYPIHTPLRNMFPRVQQTGSIQANWRAVTGINTGNMFAGIVEGRRGGVIQVSTAEYMAAFRTLGHESDVTFEAQLSAEGFDDLRARAARSGLEALMISEEKTMLGGSTSYAVHNGSACPTPTLTTATTGGALPNTTTYSVVCVPLGFDGRARSTLAGGVVQTFQYTPAEGGDPVTVKAGAGRQSAAASIATGATTGTHTITATVKTGSVDGVRGAFAYAWYWGASGSERLGAITGINRVTITATASGQLLSALTQDTDFSKNDQLYDGLLTMAANPANNSYWNACAAGAGLTADSSGGIVEIDTALEWFWDNLKLTPTRILVGTQEVRNIRRKILAQPSAAAARFTFQVQQGQIVGGGMAKGYLNPYGVGIDGPAEIPFMQHPNMPNGTIMFLTEKLPYPLSNVSDVIRFLYRQEYYQVDWPRRTRKYEYGCYVDGVLQHYFMPSLGVLTNISDA
jgi:hypothetical protein